MIPPISPLASISGVASVGATNSSPVSASREGSFANLVENAIDRVELSRGAADQAVNRFVTGQEDELHSTVLTVQRAEMEFELALQVKNKVVQAYQEIMRMQV